MREFLPQYSDYEQSVDQVNDNQARVLVEQSDLLNLNDRCDINRWPLRPIAARREFDHPIIAYRRTHLRLGRNAIAAGAAGMGRGSGCRGRVVRRHAMLKSPLES